MKSPGLYLLLLLWFYSSAVGADELAEVSYRRRPAFLNGEHVTGVWRLQPGDTISTGGGRAYATAKYLDSTRIGVMPNAKAVFQPGWVELLTGPLDVDLVRGTKHVEQIETPVGIVQLQGATGVLDLKAAEQTASRELRFSAKLGAFVFQPFATGDAAPCFTITVDKGDDVTIVVAQSGREIDLKVKKGQVQVQVGADDQVLFPALSQGRIACTPDQNRAIVSAVRGALQLVHGDKKNTAPEGASTEFAFTALASEQLFATKRTESSPAGATATTDGAVATPTKTYSGKLPQDHPYQRELRDYLASLKEADLDPGSHQLTVAPPSDDKEALYRTWLLSLDRIPRIGRKRSAPSVSAPASLFLLKTIEGPEAIMRPPAWPEPLSWFANWDYPGNPYYGSKPLKLRAFVTAAVILMLVDHAQETTPEIGVCRIDWMANHLELFGYTYLQVKDALPANVQQAYLAGVRKLTERMLQWEPKGEAIGMDLSAAVGFYYAGEALDDDKIRQGAKAYARRMFTDPQFFNSAGYFVSRGGYDASYNGQARFYAVWLAMVSGYEFAREPLEKAYRLRAHLCLPEPDGTVTGPTHFNTAASRDAWHDQYEWPFRDYSGAMLTDEAAHLTRLPSDEELANGGKARISEFTSQIKENPGYAKPEDLTVRPWSFRPWPNSWSFPQVINYAHDYYRPGSYANRAKLEEEQSPLLKLPLLRDESFVRHFDTAFTVSKNNAYAAVMHTGQIAEEGTAGIHNYAGPYGLGGGQLSAFWTPQTGSVILGRRAGMSFDRTYDHLDQWRQWPIHAVTGVRHDGAIFTTARIRTPQVKHSTGDPAEVRVSGKIPVEMLGQGKVLESPLDYRRNFTLTEDQLHVKTTLQGTGDNKLLELVETIPVYLRDLQYQRKAEPTKIEFQIAGKWSPGSPDYQDAVVAVRLTRFDGSVLITFDRARRVKLSSADWQDTYMSRAACRNIIVDLLDGKESIVFHEAQVGYTIAPE